MKIQAHELCLGPGNFPYSEQEYQASGKVVPVLI
jgi:hypothetical protein